MKYVTLKATAVVRELQEHVHEVCDLHGYSAKVEKIVKDSLDRTIAELEKEDKSA